MHTAHGFSSRLQPSLMPPPPLREVFSLVCSLSSPGKPLWLSIAHALFYVCMTYSLTHSLIPCLARCSPAIQPSPWYATLSAFLFVLSLPCPTMFSFLLPLLTFYYNLRPSPWLHYTCSTLLPMASSCIACPLHMRNVITHGLFPHLRCLVLNLFSQSILPSLPLPSSLPSPSLPPCTF